MDEKFYEKTSESGFKIIDESVYPFVGLSDFLAESKEKFVYEDDKTYAGMATDSTLFSDEGEILGSEEVTLENHPDRIEMAVSPDDIIISKLMGAKSPTILARDGYSDFAWSNGFLILRQRNARFRVKFLYYVMRSRFFKKILDEHLTRGIGISAYYPRDLLRLRIPDVPTGVQEAVVREVEEIDARIVEIRNSIPDIPKLIDQVFSEEIGAQRNGIQDDFSVKNFSARFSDLGRRKNLRCDAKYTRFFKETGGEVFRNGENSKPLAVSLSPANMPLMGKGFLKESMILVDKEDVLPKTGTIVNMEYIDRIDSDKVMFGDSDLLVSKIDPFLGHIIQNEKDKPLIGTTEFLGFRIREGSHLDYIQYAMLSESFLEATRFLISGKRQPRVNRYDLLSMKIPLPTLEEQIVISKKISHKIGDLQDKISVIESLSEEIEKRIYSALAGN